MIQFTYKARKTSNWFRFIRRNLVEYSTAPPIRLNKQNVITQICVPTELFTR